MSLNLKTGRVESPLFIKRGLGYGSERILGNNNNLTPCQLAVVNKVNKNKTHVAQWY